MSFNEFIRKYNLKNKTTSNIKKQQVLSSLSLIDVGFCLINQPFSSDIGDVSFTPFERHSLGCIYKRKLNEY